MNTRKDVRRHWGVPGRRSILGKNLAAYSCMPLKSSTLGPRTSLIGESNAPVEVDMDSHIAFMKICLYIISKNTNMDRYMHTPSAVTM